MDKFVLKTTAGDESIARLGLALKAACPAPTANTTSCCPLYTLDTDTILLSGAGTITDPLRADLIGTTSALLAGGWVTWTGTGYIYDVAPATYVIASTPQSSLQTQVT